MRAFLCAKTSIVIVVMSQTLLLKVTGITSAGVLAEVEGMEDTEDIKMHMDIGIPDEILKCFNARYPIQKLLQSPLPGKSLFDFPRRGKTWTATARDFYHNGMKEHRQLTISLSHDGFRYHKRPYLRANTSTHKREGWFVLGEDVLNDMKFLAQLKTELSATITFHYNIKHRRIDIHFYRNDAANPFLVIAFESGNPKSVVERELRF